MNSKIISISERGQITIPTNIRKKLHAKHIFFSEEDGKIFIQPVQTRDEFLEELDIREKKYLKKKTGTPLEQIGEKYDLDS